MKKMAVLFLLLLLIFNSNTSFAENNKNYFVYVSASGDNKVNIYQMNPETGDLTKLSEKTVNDRPEVLALDPQKKYMYITQGSSKKISSYSVDPQNGDLTYMNSVSVLGVPCYIATDKTGHYLLSVYWSDHKAVIHEIDGEGKLISPAVQTIATYTNPHAVLTYGDNHYALISCMGEDKIMQFAFGDSSGLLTPNSSGNFINTAGGSGPRHFVYHHTKNIVYFINELNGTVTAYHIDDSTKTLSAFQTISTLPAGFSGQNNSADIHITPDDRFLYASNRGPDTIAGFSVDSTSGELTLIGFYNTEERPREFEVDPTGNFLFAAGKDSDNLASYRINQISGALESLDVISVGDKPSWVLSVDYPINNTVVRTSPRHTPETYHLYANYPNPFNSSTWIKYHIPTQETVKLEIFNINGKHIITLVNDIKAKGDNMVRWDGRNEAGMEVSSGMYFYKLIAGSYIQSRKMMYVR